MNAPLFVVSSSGVVHVPCCSAAQRATSLISWTEDSQAPGDRKCHLCFPAVTIKRRSQ